MALEFRSFDAVDGWPGLPDVPDFLSSHLANPKHAMPLQAGMGEIDRAFIQWPVEVAAPDDPCARSLPIPSSIEAEAGIWSAIQPIGLRPRLS